jgi:hypothetical protein
VHEYVTSTCRRCSENRKDTSVCVLCGVVWRAVCLRASCRDRVVWSVTIDINTRGLSLSKNQFQLKSGQQPIPTLTRGYTRSETQNWYSSGPPQIVSGAHVLQGCVWDMKGSKAQRLEVANRYRRDRVTWSSPSPAKSARSASFLVLWLCERSSFHFFSWRHFHTIEVTLPVFACGTRFGALQKWKDDGTLIEGSVKE